jgi:o-succinylbenzoate synthase
VIELERVILREIHLPLRSPFRISSATVSERRILLLELHDRSGAVGWSECVAAERPNYSPETIDTAVLMLQQWILPAVIGTAFSHPREVHPFLEGVARGHPMAKAAVEMGVWDLGARLAGISLSRYLGGERDRVAVGISLGIQESPDRLREEAERALAQGYRKVKLKIAPGEDYEYVRRVREALGPEAPLMVDANSAYRLEDADHLARLDAFDLMMIEQPLDRTDLLRHARLQERLRTPICLDESIDCLDRVEDMLELGSGRIVNIKPGRVGGFGPSIAIHDLCAGRGVPVWCGGMLETGIGRAHNVALASLANFRLPGDLSPSARYWERDIVDPEWTMDTEGMATVPVDRPGIGVDVDVDRVADLSAWKEVVAQKAVQV